LFLAPIDCLKIPALLFYPVLSNPLLVSMNGEEKNQFSELPFTFLAIGTECIARKTVFWLTVQFSIELSKKIV
jgi:hypothetical protein